MKAVILAAGIGSRIRPLTDNKHKSLLPVGDKTIMENMVGNILLSGIHDVIVVTGYLEDQVQSFLNRTFKNASFTFITNDKYLKTNTGYSLLMTKDCVGDNSFIKFDADVVFEKEVLKKLITSSHETALCIDTNINLEAEEVKVSITQDGKVFEVGKKLNPNKAHGESIGIEKIGKRASKLLFKELERLMKNPKNHQEYYDDSYTTLVNKGIPFGIVDITGLKWVEIDTQEDYKKAYDLFS